MLQARSARMRRSCQREHDTSCVHAVAGVSLGDDVMAITYCLFAIQDRHASVHEMLILAPCVAAHTRTWSVQAPVMCVANLALRLQVSTPAWCCALYNAHRR
jgi:hypothetical protein